MKGWRATVVPVCAFILLCRVSCACGGDGNQPGPQRSDTVRIVFHEQEGTFDILWKSYPGISIQGATTGYFLSEKQVGVQDYPDGCTVSHTAGEHGNTAGRRQADALLSSGLCVASPAIVSRWSRARPSRPS